jgi:glycosyltransferase involved in cell wall biosynthesis
MDPEEFDMSLITFVPEKSKSRLQEFKELPLRIIQLEPNKFLNPYLLFQKFKQAVEVEKPDILHSHCPRSLFLMGMLSTKSKKSYTIQVYPGLQQKVLYGNIMGTVVIQLSKYFIKRIDLPIACAENVSDDLLKIDHIEVKAIPNCGSFPPTYISTEEKLDLRKKLGLDKDTTYFIFIGRLSKEKNPEFLVRTLKKLNLKKTSLIMLGEGPLKESLEAIGYPGLVLPGFVKNVNEYVKAADYYVSPSMIEGLANTLLETMAMGLPFLLSDIPPHFEVYNKTDEKMGMIFKNSDEADFEDKLKELLTYPREKASEAVRKCFTENYTAEKMSADYQQSYQDLTNLAYTNIYS